MSHFATLVIHKEGADIDEILAPFCETDEDFFEFYDLIFFDGDSVYQ